MGKLALRKPDVPASVIPIFRYDHTPIPNIFIDSFLREITSAAEIKVFLVLCRFMQERQDDEIITSTHDIANILGIDPKTVSNAFKFGEKHGFLKINVLERENPKEQKLYQISLINQVNYRKQ